MEALLLQCAAQAQKIICFRIGPVGKTNPFDGFVVLLGLQGKLAHQVKGVDVPDIERQRLLTAEFRVPKPPHSHMAKASLIEGRRTICVAALRTGLGSTGGCSPFAPIHQCILTSLLTQPLDDSVVHIKLFAKPRRRPHPCHAAARDD